MHIEGNRYKIQGTKCWISGGDHDMAENVVHLVLARVEGAPSGTKGISLFIVPKYRVNDDGSLGKLNDVVTASIEHKLGIKASTTAVLTFGENDGCEGYLCGDTENVGMKQMFQMMNGARIAVGVQGLAVAATAYLNALAYARDRQQGSSVKAFKNPDAPRVAIIEHSDVRRMLMEMKSKVEGMRALVVKLALHADKAMALAQEVEADAGRLRRGGLPPRPGRSADADREGVLLRPGVPRLRARDPDLRRRGLREGQPGRAVSAATRRSSRSTRAQITSRLSTSWCESSVTATARI